MASFRLVGNSPALAYLACRLREENHDVEWWTSGYLAQLRPLRLRSESIESLLNLLHRVQVDTSFITRSPSLESWASLVDGGSLHHVWPEMDEGFEDRWVEGSDLFRKLKAVARGLGARISDSPGSLPDPLKNLGVDTALAIDACSSETRLWPGPAFPLREGSPPKVCSTVSLWLPRFAGGERTLMKGFLASQWKGARMILEPHPLRGCVLTLSSAHSYAIEQTLKDIRNPKIAGLTGLRALFLLNGQSYSEERIRLNLGLAEARLPMAFHLGKSLGTFCPTTNLQDDWSFRNADALVERCASIKQFEGSALLSYASAWNRARQGNFRGEIGRQLLWENWLFGRPLGRAIVRISRYLPKTLRNRLQTPI